jgi:hypothetical protein
MLKLEQPLDFSAAIITNLFFRVELVQSNK